MSKIVRPYIIVINSKNDLIYTCQSRIKVNKSYLNMNKKYIENLINNSSCTCEKNKELE